MKDIHNWLNSFRTSEEKLSIENNLIPAKCISFSSGKGGVGKTTFSLKMGLELSKKGFRILVIDGDYNLSNTLVKINYPLTDNFYAFIKNKIKLEDAIVKIDNMHLLAGCNGNIDLVENDVCYDEFIKDLYNECKFKYDFIIIDSPAGLLKQNLNISAFCDYRIILITPDKSSITDSYSLIKLLKIKYNIYENFILINRCTSTKQSRKIFMTLNETSLKFLGIKNYFLGKIPEYSNKSGSFDHLLFKKWGGEINESFYKVLEAFYEKHLLYKKLNENMLVNQNRANIR